MLKNEGGHIFRDATAKKLIEIKNDFVPHEVTFVINNVNKRSKLKIDSTDFYHMNGHWLFFFLLKIQPEFTEVGFTLSNIIIAKIKKLFQES